MVEETWPALWQAFSWSMNQLLTGITEEVDWRVVRRDDGNRYVADGWRGAVVQLRGDWEFLANVIKLPNWAHKDNMCWLCKASNAIRDLQ